MNMVNRAVLYLTRGHSVFQITCFAFTRLFLLTHVYSREFAFSGYGCTQVPLAETKGRP